MNKDKLFLYAANGNIKDAKKVIGDSVPVYSNDITKTTLLTESVIHNQIDFVKFLIEQKVDINQYDGNGNTALILAVKARNFEMIRLFLENGVDVNLPDKNKLQSPLHFSCKSGISTSALMLLKAGADPNALDIDGSTPLICACISDFTIFVMLASTDKHLTSQLLKKLMTDSTNKDMEIFTMLLEHGAKINIKNKYGITALMIGCVFGKTHFVESLLKLGAGVDDCDNNGNTALMHSLNFYPDNFLNEYKPGDYLKESIIKSRIPIIELLLNYNANIKHCSNNGDSISDICLDLDIPEIKDMIKNKMFKII